MENLLVLTSCKDATCCCLPPRSAIAIISLISLSACVYDVSRRDACMSPCCPMREHVESLRLLLVTLFQIANLLLLLASVVQNPWLVQIYVWYTLAFIVMGLMVSIANFLYKIKHGGFLRSLLSLVFDVMFLFAVFRCLPCVDTYRKHLEGSTGITPNNVTPITNIKKDL